MTVRTTLAALAAAGVMAVAGCGGGSDPSAQDEAMSRLGDVKGWQIAAEGDRIAERFDKDLAYAQDAINYHGDRKVACAEVPALRKGLRKLDQVSNTLEVHAAEVPGKSLATPKEINTLRRKLDRSEQSVDQLAEVACGSRMSGASGEADVGTR